LLDHLGQTDETWKVFQELVAHDGAIVDHIASAGYFAAKQGFPEAREIFAKAEAKAEGVEEKDQVRRQEGWALINLGDNGTALANFEMSRVAAEADPNDGLVVNGSLLRGLAIACHLNGETEAAKSHYRALIAMEPEWAAAKTIADLSSSDWPQKERVPLEAVRKAVMGSSPPPAQKL
jgi:tetratricopeptide (TPR) repeat protein